MAALKTQEKDSDDFTKRNEATVSQKVMKLKSKAKANFNCFQSLPALTKNFYVCKKYVTIELTTSLLHKAGCLQQFLKSSISKKVNE